ncbi:MAG: isochorismate synthase [Thermoplasmatota archaeon]
MTPNPGPLRFRTAHAGQEWDEALQAAPAGTRMVWADDHRAIVGFGAAATLVGAGPGRFVQIREQAEALWGRLHGVGEPPVLMGGFSFATESPTSPWQGFPSAWFILPRRQVFLRGGVAWESVVEVPEVPASPVVSSLEAEDGREIWNRRVEAASRAVADGEVEKVVVARRALMPGGSPDEAFARLERTGTRYLVQPAGGAAFLGSTPETLVSIHDGTIRSHAVAGTLRTGARAGAKERREHEPVASAISEAFARLGVKARRGETRILSQGALRHLETPFEGDATGVHLLDAAAELHPTPAVAGTPRDAALRLLGALEGFERGWYSGGVGWFDHRGEGVLSVALRGGLVGPRQSILYAGAGIVPGSTAAGEWQETEAKLEPMRKALGGMP